MNISYFISKRIVNAEKNSFSATIHIVAVISVALGLATMIMTFLILVGFQNTIKDKAFSFSGHFQVSRFTLNNSYEVDPISMNRDFIANYQDYDYVEHIQEYALKPGLLTLDDEVSGVVFKGVGESFDLSRFNEYLVEGEFIQFNDSSDTKDVVISREISRQLKLGLGDEVIIFFVQNPPRFRKLTIRGIYETGLEDFDQKVILGDIKLARRLNNWPDSVAGGFEVFIKDIKDTEEAHSYLLNVTDRDLYVEDVSNLYFQIFDWLKLLDRNVVIFLSIILFVAGFNMISIVFILIMERTHMIGMLKALGANNGVIRRIFLLNGGFLVLKGLLFGNLLALGLGFIQYYFKVIPLDPENYYMEYVPIEWDWFMIISLNVMTIIIIGLVLFIPLALIARVKPIRAIRFN